MNRRVKGARINEHEKRQEKGKVEESEGKTPSPHGLPISKKEPIATAIPSMTFNTLNARLS